MEKEKIKRVVIRLHEYGMKTHDISYLIPATVDEIDAIRDDYVRLCGEIEEDYWEYEWPKVQAGIREWIQDIPEEERVKMRRDHLLAVLKELKSTPFDPRVKPLLREIKIFTNKEEGIKPEEVLRARDFPISELVHFKRRLTLCIWHDEKTPSLHLFPDNHVHCFGCGKTGDAIAVSMQLNHCSFREAVAKLL